MLYLVQSAVLPPLTVTKEKDHINAMARIEVSHLNGLVKAVTALRENPEDPLMRTLADQQMARVTAAGADMGPIAKVYVRFYETQYNFLTGKVEVDLLGKGTAGPRSTDDLISDLLNEETLQPGRRLKQYRAQHEYLGIPQVTEAIQEPSLELRTEFNLRRKKDLLETTKRRILSYARQGRLKKMGTGQEEEYMLMGQGGKASRRAVLVSPPSVILREKAPPSKEDYSVMDVVTYLFNTEVFATAYIL